MNIELVQNKYKPIITHDMHQQGGGGSRIFVPPFTEPFDPNMHPLLRRGRTLSARRWRRRCSRKARKAWRGKPLRHVVAGAPVHGLSRPAAHLDRDRQQRPRRSGEERQRPAVGPQESRRTFRCRIRGTRGRSGSRWTTASPRRWPACARREVRHRVAGQLLRVQQGHVELQRRPVRVHRARRPSAIHTAPTRCSTS